jgi:tetratricopeptide (TPR) repeat protein
MRSLLLLASLIAFSLPAGAAEAIDAPAIETDVLAPPADATSPQKARKPSELRAEQLDTLFARLHQPGIASQPVEAQIWALWGASDSPTAEVLLAQAQRAINDGAPAEALSILNTVIAAYPDFAEAWNKRATLYFMMKRYDQSLADIDKVLDLEPRHFGALSGKGMILERQKKYAQARAAFEEALAVNPNLEQVKDALKELDRVEQGI